MKNSPIESIHERWKLARLYYRRLRALGLAKSGRVFLRPRSIAFHFRRVLLGQIQGRSNFYSPSASRADEMHFCEQILSCDQAAVEEVFTELEQDQNFVDRLCNRYQRVRPDSPVPFHLGRFKVWYAIVRLLKPKVVLETGVHDGLSSTLILRAMARNDRGCLVSIDLPDLNLPNGVDSPGWLIPDELKTRWRPYFGDSRRLLPVLARDHAPVDVFIHDSDHSAEFQTFEYRTVRPFLGSNGLLLGDDAIPELFATLAKEWDASPILVRGAAPETGVMLGAIRFRSQLRNDSQNEEKLDVTRCLPPS